MTELNRFRVKSDGGDACPSHLTDASFPFSLFLTDGLPASQIESQILRSIPPPSHHLKYIPSSDASTCMRKFPFDIKYEVTLSSCECVAPHPLSSVPSDIFRSNNRPRLAISPSLKQGKASLFSKRIFGLSENSSRQLSIMSSFFVYLSLYPFSASLYSVRSAP